MHLIVTLQPMQRELLKRGAVRSRWLGRPAGRQRRLLGRTKYSKQAVGDPDTIRGLAWTKVGLSETGPAGYTYHPEYELDRFMGAGQRHSVSPGYCVPTDWGRPGTAEVGVAQTLCRSKSAVLNMVNVHFL
jgi:hypothetical protein